MFTSPRGAKTLLFNLLMILVLVLPGLIEPLTLLAAPQVGPPNCSGADIVLLAGDTTLTIENPVITNVSSIGCTVSGTMRLQLLNLNEGGIPITGKIDSFNRFTSTSIAKFTLPIAGLRLVVYSSSFKDGDLLLTNPSLKIPDSWGGLEASLGKTLTVNSQGLMSPEFFLPAIATSKLALQLSGRIGVYGNGFIIQASGALALSDMGKAKDCFIKASVTLSVDVFGNSVMAIATHNDDGIASLAAHRSQIEPPSGQFVMVAAPMPLESSYLPLPESLPQDVLQELIVAGMPEPEESVEPGMRLDSDWAVAPDEGDSCGWETHSASADLYDLWDDRPASRQDLYMPAAYPVSFSQQATPEPEAVGIVVSASWQCAGKGIPIGTTGFQLTKVAGTVTLLHTEQSVALEVTFETQAQLLKKALVSIDGATRFQWSPGFEFSLQGVVSILSMFEVGGAHIWYNSNEGVNLRVWWTPLWPPVSAELRVRAWISRAESCIEWATVCRDRPPPGKPDCRNSCVEWDTSTKFHLTGSVVIDVGLKKGHLLSAGSVPYPCHCRMCRKWGIPYPCCRWCSFALEIPPYDIWLAGAGAQFGSFTGDRWGLKGTVSFLGFSTGFYIDHKGEMAWGDVSGYQLVDSYQVLQARRAWQAATVAHGPEAAFAGDETFTFLPGDRTLVHFGLPLAEPYRAELDAQSQITYTATITQTDMLFTVSADVPLAVSLISPDGVEITPANHDQQPGGYIVGHSQTEALEPIAAPGPDPDLARWRFVPASNVGEFHDVDVLLDGEPVFTQVSIDDDQVRHYVEIEPGTYTVEVRPVSVSSPYLSTPLAAVAGTDYTVLLIGYDTAELFVLADDNSPPAEGTGRVRVVNAATGIGPVDVSLDGLAFPAVSYRQTSGYQAVISATHSVTAGSGAIDPVLGVELEAEQRVWFGTRVAWAGDVNGDGYDDLLVSDPGYDNDRGRVYLYLGSAAGLNPTPAWVAQGEGSGDKFGMAVAGVGDVNGDGFDDILVGAYGYRNNLSWGKVYLYLGSGDGPASTPVWTDEGTHREDRFGAAVAGAGDVDGDGYADILVGALGYPEGEEWGQVRLYYGSADGIRAPWTAAGSTHTRRAQHAAALLPDGRVLVMGGNTPTGTTNTSELFDPATGQWTVTAGAMSQVRRAHTATPLADGRVLVVGGWDDEWNALSGAEIYNPDTGQWTLTGSLDEGRADHTATLLNDGRVLVTGGETSGTVANTAEIYDPATGLWSAAGTMHLRRTNHTATRLLDGTVLVAGGWDDRGLAVRQSELYHPDMEGGSWERLVESDLNDARGSHTATLLPDGRVLVTGGLGDGSSNSAEVYVPEEQAWSRVADMHLGRHGHAAVALQDGRVLVAGGESFDPVGELYDPHRDTWVLAGSIQEMRDWPTLTLLADGRAVLVGGTGREPDTEIFDPTRFWSATGENNEDMFGATLAAAGDVNGDGYADILIGAPGYRESGDDCPRAKVYAYLGSQAGLAPTPAWTVSGDTGFWCGFGEALAGAGDVNGDGYDDVLIGANNWGWDAGTAHLYAGSATGLSEAPVWTGTGVGESDWFGAAVSGAGDVNRDGYADILVGAYSGGSAGQGEVTLFYGSGAGIGVSGWAETDSLHTARWFHQATELNDGRVLVTGGFFGNANVELYDPATRQWIPTGSTKASRVSHTATRLDDGRVLAVGGQQGRASAEIYDPSTGIWAWTGSLQTGRAWHSATLLADGRVLIAGGSAADHSYLVSAELYNPATGSWTATGNMTGPHANHTATRLADGRVLVAGGWPGGASAQLYNPETGTWSATGSMNAVRDRHTATLLPNGRVLVVGGEGGAFLASAELYDPATGLWTLTGSMAAARGDHSATLLPDGRVLVAGGWAGGGSLLSSAEIYDPATGTWEAAPSLQVARRSHTATLLADGQVLVAGGEAQGVTLSHAEVLSQARAPWSVSGPGQAGASFGESVAGGGDATGNGYADFAIGEPAGDGGGRAYVYYSGVALSATDAPVEDGDVQTLLLARMDGSPDALALLQIRDANYAPTIGVITTTVYAVDQATKGTWTVSIEGDIENAIINISAVAAPNPPILTNLTVDASDLENTLVVYELLSDHHPVTMQIYANDGPLTDTLEIPLPEGMVGSSGDTRTEEVTLFQGLEVAQLVLSDPLAAKGTVITTTIDLSFLQSGDYKLWVRVEDGVSPPVQGYVWGVEATAAEELPAAWNQVRIAAADYDAVKQMAGAALISIDHRDTWSDTFDTVITAQIEPEGLYIEFLPYDHPDVNTYLLEVTEAGVTHVITTGLSVHYADHEDLPDIEPIHYAHFGGLSPLRTYTVRIAALDLDHDLASWSKTETFTVPQGNMQLVALQPALELPPGQQALTTILELTMTDDLFSDVYVALDTHQLPEGITLQALAYEPQGEGGTLAQLERWGNIPAPTRQMPAPRGWMPVQASTSTTSMLVHATVSVAPGVPAADYTLPFVAHSGQLERRAEIALRVPPPPPDPLPPDVATILVANLPLPSCATAITVTIPVGAFGPGASVQFLQASNNVLDIPGWRFAGSHWTLTALNAGGNPVQPSLPLALVLTYDPACLLDPEAEDLHLRRWATPAGWGTTGVDCTVQPENNTLTCEFAQTGRFALFEPAPRSFQLLLPIVRRRFW